MATIYVREFEGKRQIYYLEFSDEDTVVASFDGTTEFTQQNEPEIRNWTFHAVYALISRAAGFFS